ncbi:hypothetical protein [Pseudosulfitobacter pseudonitzschiae]|uniref:hypothetical protein n=1 Tax=Pseudosulfitobacter pseudonitzschiae TaxID=1402135 RepID=UPI003B7C39E3
MQDQSSGNIHENESREDLLDRIEGLEADLDDAVSVAVARGAVDWARLNYPDHMSHHANSKAMTPVVAASRSALHHARMHHVNMIACLRKHLESGGILLAHLEMPSACDDLEALIEKHEFAASSLAEIIDGFEPVASNLLEASLRKMMVDVARAERKRCEAAVGCAWAPVQGTPYITGPRRFCEAIRALPKIEDVLEIPATDFF